MMDWYAGFGAAKVLAHDGPALLLERLAEQRDLSAMARSGKDDEATEIICSVVAKLHAPRARQPPESLVPMSVWFRPLDPAARCYGGILTKCATAARDLLAQPQGIIPLHGDIHHGNILDGGERGWLAIDPKGVLGERGFDYANLFRNPEALIAAETGRLQRRVEIVARSANLEPNRLLTWILAYAGLGVAWTLDSGGKDEAGLAIASIAAAELEVYRMSAWGQKRTFASTAKWFGAFTHSSARLSLHAFQARNPSGEISGLRRILPDQPQLLGAAIARKVSRARPLTV
jgi:streptomycin 6-kinase